MDAADPDRAIAGTVRAGRIDDVRRLLDAGARPDQMNIYGDTLVDMARDRGHDDVAAFLEEALTRASCLGGAAPNLPDDEPWATPLAWATRRGHTQIVDMLQKAGAR